MGIFDLRSRSGPIEVFELPHLVDDVASKPIGKNIWEVAVSGCWAAVSSIFHVQLNETLKFEHKVTKTHTDRTFSHGVRYDAVGRLCIALHTGVNPRILVADEVFYLPYPWGPRCVCYAEPIKTYFAVAVSANPKLEEYKQTSTSIWCLGDSSSNWEMRYEIDGAHSDACEVYQNRIWFPDQKNDRVLGICLENKHEPIVLSGKCFDFPHGLSISSAGTLAVTNYGNSSVVLIDLIEVLRQHTEAR